ncbi:MAG: hypothetical protein Q8Q07_06335 [Dehalococcoidales bacterium]|nr:hypothetical protein [Dehalococcoidales bacterium]
MMQFLKAVPRIILTPALVSGMVALVLFFLGAVPDYINPPEAGYRKYSSMEEAEAVLGFRVAVPSYFPDYLSWPPAEIYGQRKPVLMMQLLFLSRYGNFETMIISQIKSDLEDLPVDLPWFETIRQKTPVSIGVSKGVLITGVRADGQLLSGVYWRSGDYYYVVITTRSERELLTIARSM